MTTCGAEPEHQRCARGELAQHPVIAQLVPDAGSHAATQSELAIRKRRPSLAMRAKGVRRPRVRHELVDSVRAEEVGEVAGQVGCAGEVRGARPDLGRELCGRHTDKRASAREPAAER